MRIGLISDTHGKLRPQVFDHFEGVDLILHAGDIGSTDVLVELEAIAPVHAVWGNTDDPAVRARVREIVRLELAGLATVLVHGDRLRSLEPDALRAEFPAADVIVHGHTHKAIADRRDGRLVVNPGAAGPARFRVVPSVALLMIERGAAEVRIVPIG